MALESINYVLQLIASTNSEVPCKEVRDMLGVDEGDLVVTERTSTTQYFLFVNFPAVELEPIAENWLTEEDLRHERMAVNVAHLHDRLAEWISRRAYVLDRLRGQGLAMTLLGNLWISSDQLDLVLTPGLALACGQAGIKIYLLSND